MAHSIPTVKSALMFSAFIFVVYKLAGSRDDRPPQQTAEYGGHQLLRKDQRIAQEDENHNAVKTILLWNRWYLWPDFRFGLGPQPFRDKCGVTSPPCATTTDRSLATSSADVIVFFASLVYFKELPVRRQGDDRLWVFMDAEPPASKYGLMANFGLNINATVTYRTDSTIHWPYGTYEPITSGNDVKVPTVDDVRRKTRPVAWMASRCGMNANNVRMWYVNELSKHIAVDIYGKCGNYSCDNGKYNTTGCMETIENTYKFYLAFENSVCVDYVTEKAFRTLQYNLVPVVMGGANYTKLLPPNSFIDVADFDSPKALADYLRRLDGDPEAYMKYLSWKRLFVVRDVIPDSTAPFCELCKMVHERSGTFKRDFNVSEWWEEGSCVMGWGPLAQKYGLKPQS